MSKQLVAVQDNGNDLSRHDLLEVEEPRANIDFWSYLDPLPRLIDLPGVERHIWSLVCLVNQQQVTETLGEIRLRRYDIHRKLLDTCGMRLSCVL